MPPKIRFTKDDVIEAAFKTVEENGFNGMSTQKVADMLNSSVQPLYSQFENIDALKRVVAIHTQEIYRNFIFGKYSDSKCMDPWIGEVLFAKEHPKLYFALFVERNDHEDLFYEVNKETFDSVCEADELKGLHIELIHSFYRHMQIYIYGLAIMVCNKYWKDETDEGLIRVIKEQAAVLLKATHNGQILRRGQWFNENPET